MGADPPTVARRMPIIGRGAPGSRIRRGRAARIETARRQRAVSVEVVERGQAELFEVVDALDAAGRFRAACTAGNNKPIKTAMIAITTNNSMSVKPRVRLR